MDDNDKLISYIFLSGFLSGTIFTYSGLMTFVTGMATGVVCSRAGWIEKLYQKFSGLTGKDWLKFHVNINKIVT